MCSFSKREQEWMCFLHKVERNTTMPHINKLLFPPMGDKVQKCHQVGSSHYIAYDKDQPRSAHSFSDQKLTYVCAVEHWPQSKQIAMLPIQPLGCPINCGWEEDKLISRQTRLFMHSMFNRVAHSVSLAGNRKLIPTLEPYYVWTSFHTYKPEAWRLALCPLALYICSPI